jgi:superfamily II RNA helicase
MTRGHATLSVSELLRGVGEAPPAPFAPAAFQLEALAALERGDVLVAAPTGSGKTWIAEREIARLLAGDPHPEHSTGPGRARVWYTAPLKALSNQKFRRFQRLYGEAAVGLLTGERRVNPEAPVLVATTEILRNVLYDRNAAHASPAQVVVLDEAHYLADPERGTAWEEILLLAPRETRLLLLSATIPNVDELAAWLGEVRGRGPRVVRLDTRPVPLQYLLADGAGRLVPPVASAVLTEERTLRWLHAAAEALEHRRLTPAILFFPSRRECDEAARALGGRQAPGEERRAARIDAWIEQVPELAGHPLITPLRRAGVAPHHAGHLTAWRMCVEELLEEGLVRLVCATTTLAAGLDVPARTVLLSTLYRNSPEGPASLTPTEFHQMTGRAGRRGRDTLGIAVIGVENPSQADEGLALADAAPDPVRSAFTPSDAQVLNLLARATLSEAEAMVQRSFAAFQRRAETAPLRVRLDALPPDPLTERPCGDRVATRARFDRLLRDLRRARHRGAGGAPAGGAPDGDRIASLGREVVQMPCTGCPVVDRCLATLNDQRAVERKRRALAADLSDLERQEVRVFRNRAAVLRDLGYLDPHWRLTATGAIAARIRHPRMLLLSEAVRARVLPADPVALAAVAGALGTERMAPPHRRPPLRRGNRRRYEWRAAAEQRWQDPDSPEARMAAVFPPAALQQIRTAVAALRSIIARVNARRNAAGVPEDPVGREFEPAGGGPAPALQRAAVVGEWAAGRHWAEVVARHRIPEGDLQRLVWQAAEILAQLEDLPSPALASAARAGREAMLRSPVL